ncbi:MAG: hypothetical protein ACRC8O_09005 [Plesiomonas shigelloides]
MQKSKRWPVMLVACTDRVARWPDSLAGEQIAQWSNFPLFYCEVAHNHWALRLPAQYGRVDYLGQWNRYGGNAVPDNASPPTLLSGSG